MYRITKGMYCAMMLGVVCSAVPSFAQTTNDTSVVKDYYQKKLDPIEVDVLFSYYEQDGNHSPVTGGVGTEHLTDVVSQVAVVVPYKKHKFNILAGVDNYTSASTDKISPATISSASSRDTRAYATVGWQKERSRGSHGLHMGFSTEYDVNSVSLGGSWSWKDRYDNNELSVSGQFFRDQWSLIYPVELRWSGDLPKGRDNRYIYDASLSWSFVVNKRMQSTLTLQGIHQSGLLSTPFHRVYFGNQETATIEHLPRQRWKIPASIRVNYFIHESVVLRAFYRYYWDDFDIRAHTAEIELPVRLGLEWAVIPSYRYHTQTASQYFAPINSHFMGETYYTSDYDLSGFDSHQIGLGFRYAPIGGLWKSAFKIPYTRRGIEWKKIEVRAAYYQRADGLKAWVASLGTKFVF